jgi:hypothetical protein
MKKVLLSAMLATAALASVPAQAVTISFGFTNTNVPGGDQSGKTSPFLDPSNNLKPNVFVETFDNRGPAPVSGQRCGIDTPTSLVTISTGGTNTYGIRQGTITDAAAPSGDSTCYAYGPEVGGALPDRVTVNYAGLIAQQGGAPNYLGIYYGSIDNYNDLIFTGTNGVITTVTGQSLIDLFNGTSGDQVSNATNVYVNLFFAPGEQFRSFTFETRGIAFEMDNVVVGYVPEPGSIALLGLGLAALGVTRRRAAHKSADKA